MYKKYLQITLNNIKHQCFLLDHDISIIHTQNSDAKIDCKDKNGFFIEHICFDKGVCSERMSQLCASTCNSSVI